MNQNLQALLKSELKLLSTSEDVLKYSYEQCKKIDLSQKLTESEKIAFEAFSARFARSSDILLQKIWRLIDTLEFAPEGSVLDRIHRAEKRDFVNAEVFKKIRILRNEITHEYDPQDFLAIYQAILKAMPDLMSAIAKTKDYCQQKF
jgi:hypothetical protein